MSSGTGNLVKRLASFSVLPFLGALLPFVVLPILARVTTADEWTAINVGFGIGAITAAVALVGWNILGTPLVALAASTDERHDLYSRSFYIRSIASIALFVPATILSWVMAPSSAWPLAAMMAIAITMSGLSISWYAVGVSNPRMIALYDIAPRAAATALALGLVLWTGNPLWYGFLLTVSAVVGTLLFHRSLLNRLWPAWPGFAALAHDIRNMRAAWGVESVANTYANAPVPLASVLTPVAASSAYASADRIYRYGTMLVAAVGNALQGWVLEAGRDARRTRNLAAIVVMTAIGIVGAAFLTFVGPWFSGLLFGADKQGDPAVMAVLGVAFFGVSASTPLIRNILMPARVDRPVLAVTVGSAIVGLGLMVILGIAWGGLGVATGFAASEIITFVACAVLAMRAGLHPVDISDRGPRARD